MRPETASALFDMDLAAGRIAEAIRGKSFEQYGADWLLQSAIERQFEILGEALVRIRQYEKPVFDQIPDALKIVALRNIIIHGYDAVDSVILWDLAQEKVPALINILAGMLAEARRQGL